MSLRIRNLALAALAVVSISPASHASTNDWNITDGQGEKVQIKHGLFGGKQAYVQDRIGDKFYKKKGLFGTKETDVSFLGNSMVAKKGLLGHTDYEGRSIFGDTIKTKKGFFGRRKTDVNVSGISNVVKGLINGQSASATQGLPGRIPQYGLPAGIPGPGDAMRNAY